MKFMSRVLVASAFSLCIPVSAQDSAVIEESVEDAASRFGVRASVLDISLSPSGNKIAWIAPGPEHTEVLKVFDMTGSDGVQTIISNSEKSGDLNRCD